MNAGPMHGSHAPGGSHRPADVEEELAAEGLELTPQRHELDSPAALDPDQVEARSTLAQYLRPSIFPADVAQLVAAAAAEAAPPSLVARLGQLPPASYRTVNEVWVSLGGAAEARPDVPTSEPPRREPAPVERPLEREGATPAPGLVGQLAGVACSTATTAVRIVLGVPAAIVSRISHLLGRH
jgi:hypothetical protein